MKKICQNKDVITASLIFIAGITICIAMSVNLILPLTLGGICYFLVALKRGYSFGSVLKFFAEGMKESLVVIEILMLVGVLSGIWRLDGTIGIFVHYSMKVITPGFFILATFLLCCFFSYALGTCFGVAGTLGIILIAVAKAGDVNVLMTAGAVLSGGYFGDRCSPVSSSAVLTAFVTKTELSQNMKLMFKTMIVPMIITTAMYGILSFTHPLKRVDTGIESMLSEHFRLTPLLMLPVIVLILLPLLKVDIKLAIVAGAVIAVVLAITIQGRSLSEAIDAMIFGYHPSNPNLAGIFGGGGMITMLNISRWILISCGYTGIIKRTDLFKDMTGVMVKGCNKVGRSAMTLITGTVFSGLFCSQSVAILMNAMMLRDAYPKTGGNDQELALDIENLTVLSATWVPWGAALMAAFSAMDVPAKGVMYAFYVFVLPVYYLLTKRFTYAKLMCYNNGGAKVAVVTNV